MNIIIATNNTHKLIEIARILPHWSFMTPADAGVRFRYPERGRTFLANALGKARHCLRMTAARYAVIADDSGICVDALGGRPGVHSARFGRGRGIGVQDDRGRNALLLQQLARATRPAGRARADGALTDSADRAHPRAAHYVCAAVLIVPHERLYVVQERWDGVIATAISAGRHGFGYDPLFIPAERSVPVAELTAADKDCYSHRAQAFRALAAAYRANQPG